MTETSGFEEPTWGFSRTFPELLAVLSVLNVASFVTFATVGTGQSQPPLYSLALILFVLSYLGMPIVGYLDLRHVRNSAQWSPRWRGYLWVIALVVPLISPGICATYLLRRRDALRHGGFWQHWHHVVIIALVAETLGIILLSAYQTPDTEPSTLPANLGGAIWLATTPIPAIGTLFDLGYLRKTLGDRFKKYHWLWFLGNAVWVFQIPSMVVYWWWRRTATDFGDAYETLEDAIETARDCHQAGVEAAVDDQYQVARNHYDEGLDALRDAIGIAQNGTAQQNESAVNDDSTPPPRRVSETVTELRERLKARRTQADVKHNLQQAKSACEDRVSEEVLATINSGIDECEKRRTELSGADAIGILESTTRDLQNERDALEAAYRSDAIHPLEDDLETAYAAGRDARAADEYSNAISHLEAAQRIHADLEARRELLGDDKTSPVSRSDIDGELRAVKRQRALEHEIRPLADDLRRSYQAGLDALDDGAFETARTKLDTAVARYDELASLVDGYEVEFEYPVSKSTLRAKRSTARQELTAQRLSELQDSIEAAERNVRSALEREEYEHALDVVETAKESIDEAEAVTAEHAYDDVIADYRSRLSDLEQAIHEQRREAAYEEAITQGEHAEDAARENANAGDYEAAVDACREARSAYEDALEIVDEHGIGTRETVEENLERVRHRYPEYLARHLGQRVVENRVSDETGTAEDFRTAADTLEELASHIESLDYDAGDDLDLIREEARREQIKARLLAEREHAETAVARTREDDYETARDEFETIRERLRDLHDDADTHGITAYADQLDALAEMCEQNSNAARRAMLGITDNPQISSVTLTLDHEESDANTAVQSTPDSPSRPNEPAVDDALRDQLPSYDELGHIGSGGNADVYHVRLEDGTDAALKVPRWEGTLSTKIMDEFANESETWSKLDDHPHIVSIRGWGSSPYPWMLLEYLPASLDATLDQLSIEESVEVLTDVANALEFAHGRGVIHLDVKPENVLLTEDRTPKVGDWGLSQVVLEHTRTQMGLTPPYSAPEQLSDDYGDLTRRTDVYQLSVLAYRLLTGRLPFEADRPADLQRQILSDEPPEPTSLNPDLPPAADEVLRRGLAKSPTERYEAVVLLRNELVTLTDDR